MFTRIKRTLNISSLQVHCDAEEIRRERRWRLRRGMSIRIINGPLLGQTGTVEKLNVHERVHLLMHLLGRAVKVVASADDIMVIEPA